MTLGRRRFLQLAAGAAALPALARPASAQSYPTRAVRIIVPYSPAGPTDVFSRLMAQKLSEQLGQQFFVENLPGAGGNIGMGRAAKAAPDGYTVVMVGAPFVINPGLYEQVPYDPVKDYEPITLAVSTTNVLTIHPSLPAQNVKELVELIRANPGKYSYASPSTGTPAHLVGELFRLSLKLDLVHVPYSGGGAAVGATLAGHSPISWGTPPPAIPLIKEGKLRALGVSSKARAQALPDVPTMAEAGYPEVEGEAWFAALAPAGTPKEIVTLLNREIVRAVALPDIKERLAVLGFESVASSPAEFARQIKADMEKWGKVIRAANIKAQ